MLRKLMLLALLFAMPVIALLVANYVQSEFSGHFDNLDSMRTAAWWAIGISATLLLLIKLAGRVARSNRSLLLWVFKPGLYITALAVVGLVLIHAGLAIGVIYYGEAALFGRVHIGVFLSIAIGTSLGVIVLLNSAFDIPQKATSRVFGGVVTREDAPRLWQAIEETARRLGSLVPDHAVVGLEPNFFVTEANVTCLDGTLSGRTLYCSLPFARIMSRDEFIAVLGHELGHFKGEDTKFSAKFYPIYRGTTASLQALEDVGEEDTGSIALLPAVAVFDYFLDSFSTAESAISRDRELAADQAGASVTSAATIATALVKLHAFSGIWEHLQLAAVERLKEGQCFINTSMLFAEFASHMAESELLEGLDATHLAHPTDSHPQLATRLQALGMTLAQLHDDALDVSPLNPAIDLFEDVEAREDYLSECLQRCIADSCGIASPDDTTESSDEEPVTELRNGSTETTQIGYVNRNYQKCLGTRGVAGTDHGQRSYRMECRICGHEYGANGTDVHLRKCPVCQDGRPGIPY